jgi:hypothetical protein
MAGSTEAMARYPVVFVQVDTQLAMVVSRREDILNATSV